MARISKNEGNIKLRAKKKKAVTITKLKAQLWQLCRQLIIRLYGNTCYTCGATGLVGANLQVGHFIPSSVCSMEMRYSLANLRPQCFRCNIHLSGNWVAFEAHLMLEEGHDFPTELKRENEKSKGLLYGRHWILNKIALYTQLLDHET